MAWRSWSASKVVRLLPMSRFYGILDYLSSMVAMSKPFAVRTGRRPVPEQVCRAVTRRGRVFADVCTVYVYGIAVFFGETGITVDSRRRGQLESPSRLPTLTSRGLLPGSVSGLGQCFQGRFRRAGFLQPAATLLHLAG